MSPQVLVTGGLGFIGSYLVRELLQDATTTVTIVDDLSGTALGATEIVESITQGRPGKLVVHTLGVDEYCAGADACFDEIYHLASIVGPAAVLAHAGFIVESMVQNTVRVIELARKSAARLVNVSTSEIYGGGSAGYCSEDTPRVVRGPATARQEYAVGKLAAEVAIENLCHQGRLDAVTVRPFNVAGPRQSGRGGFVLPRFVGQAILGQPLTVFGDGKQVRAFTDARDVVNGLVLCARRGHSGRAYNVGNPANRISIGELADRVLGITGSAAGKKFIDPRRIYGPSYAEATDKFPDAARIMQLGWQPKYALEVTIADVHAALRALPTQSVADLCGLSGSGDDAQVGNQEPNFERWTQETES